MYNVVPPQQQRSRIPVPIYAQAVAPRPQIYRATQPASMAAIYVVPRSVYIEEEKRVRFGGWTDQKMRRSSGSGRRHHVKSILKTPHIAPRQPRQLLKPGERLHKDRSSLSLYPSLGSSTKVVLKGHHKSASSGSFTTSYWMQVDRWIDQRSVRPGRGSVTCRGCQVRVRMSLEQSSLERMQKWKEHKRECEAITKAVKREQLEMSL
ncbi:hypothetical protein CPB85DRAFT_1445574 [Mucidula mucida]|nr:hypothetical protein CPB85DRAFT_1445574 [Mucidula mucida]